MTTEKTCNLFGDLALHIEHARKAHPWPDDMADAAKFKAAENELHELSAAMLKGNTRQIRAEALDCAAVLLRIAGGE